MANEMESAVDALMHIVHSRPGTPPAEDQKPIQAYAKLQGEDFVYYIRSLSVLLGRKTSPYDEVQVDLGNSKIVSRVHARIEYNFVTRSFELSCMGKNGVFIDGKFFGKDAAAVPLETKTLIQIGEKWFYFLLPVSTVQQGPLNDQNRRYSSHTYGSRSSGREGSPGATVPNSPSSSRGGSPGDDGDIPDYKIYPDIKPPFSYASMIAQAINSSPDKRLSLSSIYQYITDNYPYYRTAQNGWQNSIRHNLSLNKAFIKMARAEHEPGKGAFWAIDPQYAHQFQDGNFTSPNVKQRKPSQNVSPNTLVSKSEDQLSENSEEPARKKARVSVDSSEPLVTPAAEEPPQSEAPKEAEEAAPVATETAPAEVGDATPQKE